MRVLVTGAAGFVGSHVVEAVERSGWTVVPFDARWDDRWDDVELVDVVISLAATANPVEALRDPVRAYVNSTRVMAQTMEYARENGARVLHVSSNEATNPKGPYAGAKACQEIVCEATDWPATVVVTQSLFGERQQWDKLVPTVIRKLLAGEPVELQRKGLHWASRPFMHVRNLADALVLLCEAEPWDLPDRVNVGMDQSMSVLYLAHLLGEAVGRSPLIEPVEAGDRPGHELHAEPVGCDLDDWKPGYDTAQALKDVAAWYMDNPEWMEPPDEHNGHQLQVAGGGLSAQGDEQRPAA